MGDQFFKGGQAVAARGLGDCVGALCRAPSDRVGVSQDLEEDAQTGTQTTPAFTTNHLGKPLFSLVGSASAGERLNRSAPNARHRTNLFNVARTAMPHYRSA